MLMSGRIFNFQKAYAVRSNFAPIFQLYNLVISDIGRTYHCWRAARVIKKVCASSGMSNFQHIVTVHTIFFQVTQSDSVEEQENAEDTMARLGSRVG